MSAQLQMKIVPMINALLTGMGLLISGLTMRFLVWPNVLPKKDGKQPLD